jgi:hypothetical protein
VNDMACSFRLAMFSGEQVEMGGGRGKLSR